jgi:hypothetical protein
MVQSLFYDELIAQLHMASLPRLYKLITRIPRTPLLPTPLPLTSQPSLLYRLQLLMHNLKFAFLLLFWKQAAPLSLQSPGRIRALRIELPVQKCLQPSRNHSDAFPNSCAVSGDAYSPKTWTPYSRH